MKKSKKTAKNRSSFMFQCLDSFVGAVDILETIMVINFITIMVVEGTREYQDIKKEIIKK